MKTIAYNREAAVEYAQRWVFGKNPLFADFDDMGGDCTNFASQILWAGGGVMNYTPVMGWYYRTLHDRTASWSGVEFLYRFLTRNRAIGPWAEEAGVGDAQVGDICQLSFDGVVFRHSPVVVGIREDGELLLAAHSAPVYDKPLSMYTFEKARVLHIMGIRTLD